MSFLNSVLSSIGSNTGQPLTPPAQPSGSPVTNTRQPASAGPNGIPLASKIRPNDKKRKADEELEPLKNKVLKRDVSKVQISQVTPNSQNRTASTLGQRKPETAPSAKQAIPCEASKRAPITEEVVKKPNSHLSMVTDVSKAPKKGSYAEIMARAKASQSKPPAIGVISHKPKDKIAMSHKKELKLKKKALKDRKLGIKEDERPVSSGRSSSSPAAVSADKAKQPQPGYKGTAKPKPQPQYKGTMKPGMTTVPKPTSRDRDVHASKGRYNEYAATDEEDLDDIEEDDYGSDESEDMEAGFSDVEQEETVAAKVARKEDEEEARLEAKLKSEKEERKKKLEAMAKKAKPQRY